MKYRANGRKRAYHWYREVGMDKHRNFLTGLGMFFAVLVLSGVAVLALWGIGQVSGCRATFPVTINNQRADCTYTVTHGDGTFSVQGCRNDGTQPVEAGGSPGDDVLHLNVPDGGVSARQPEPIERYARNRWPIRPTDARLN